MPADTPSLDAAVPLQALLGYVNFSTGKPDPRFQKQINDAYAFFAAQGSAEPWTAMYAAFQDALTKLHAGGGAAFREVDQARAVLDLAFAQLLPAYRKHHERSEERRAG